MSINNKIIIAWLNSEQSIGFKTIEKLINHFGTAEAIWYNLHNEKQNIAFIKDEVIYNLINKKNDFEEILLKRLEKEKVQITTILDDDYPKKLRDIINPPSILYCKGDISCLDDLSIGIVGSRKATAYGKLCADKFAKELTNLGITTISGLAYGIDTIVHKSTILANGKTIGVLGCGINIVYPLKNNELYEKVVASGGAIITEYPFDMAPMSSNFPCRNRIISGLSSGILVIEAQDKSGTLITANHAADQGKDVYAIPGNINSIFSIGTNKLIRDGAKLVLSVDDIIEELPEFNIFAHKFLKKKINYDILSEIEKDIVDIIKEGEKSCDDIANFKKYSVAEILSCLSILEMKSIIIQTSGKKFVLAN
jgi:DNA processing protein